MWGPDQGGPLYICCICFCFFLTCQVRVEFLTASLLLLPSSFRRPGPRQQVPDGSGQSQTPNNTHTHKTRNHSTQPQHTTTATNRTQPQHTSTQTQPQNHNHNNIITCVCGILRGGRCSQGSTFGCQLETLATPRCELPNIKITVQNPRSHKQSRTPQNPRPWQHAPHHGMKTSDRSVMVGIT